MSKLRIAFIVAAVALAAHGCLAQDTTEELCGQWEKKHPDEPETPACGADENAQPAGTSSASCSAADGQKFGAGSAAVNVGNCWTKCHHVPVTGKVCAVRKPNDAHACFENDVQLSGTCSACITSPDAGKCVSEDCVAHCNGKGVTPEGCGKCVLNECKDHIESCTK